MKATSAPEQDPHALAEAILEAHGHDSQWLDTFIEALDRRRAGRALERLLSAWGLDRAEAATLFGVPRSAITRWLSRGVPPERVEAMADLAAATDWLCHYLKRDRIPAVVRRPAPALGGQSLLEMASEGRTRDVLKACRDMFDFERAHG